MACVESEENTIPTAIFNFINSPRRNLPRNYKVNYFIVVPKIEITPGAPKPSRKKMEEKVQKYFQGESMPGWSRIFSQDEFK